MKTATLETTQPAAAHDHEPHGFEDLPWRIGYRVRRGLFHVFGPPTLNDKNNPHVWLAQERAARYANRCADITQPAA